MIFPNRKLITYRNNSSLLLGAVPNGLNVHPDRQHFIYPVGCMVIIEDINTKKQEFLSGHTDSVTCISISQTGKYVASGQQTHMGFKVR